MMSSERVGPSGSSSSEVVPAANAAPGTSTLGHAAAKPKRKKSKSHSIVQENTPGLRSCTIATCRRPLPAEWKHRTCERCLQRSRRARERKRLRTMLEKALEADSVEPVTCTICTHIIPVIPGQEQEHGQPRRQQFVLCASCQGRMASANAPPPVRSPRSTLVPGVSGVPPAIHIVADKPDPGATTSSAGAAPATPAGAMSAKVPVPPRLPAARFASTLALATRPPGPMQGWSFDVEKTIERLVNTPHLNAKGEYINPQFLPETKAGVGAGSKSAGSDVIVKASSTLHLPQSLLMHSSTLQTSSISPVDVTPHTSASTSTSAPARRTKGSRTGKLPMIRIPPRPAFLHPSSQLATPATASASSTPSVAASASFPFPSPVQTIPTPTSSESATPHFDAVHLYANPGSSAPGKTGNVRLCMTPGCNAVLSPRHKWILCNRCLKSGMIESGEGEVRDDTGEAKIGEKAAKSGMQSQLAPVPETGEPRRMSEPAVPVTEATVPATGRRASESVVIAGGGVKAGVIRVPPLKRIHAPGKRRQSESAAPHARSSTTYPTAKSDQIANSGPARGLPAPPPSATVMSALGIVDASTPLPREMTISFEVPPLDEAVLRPPSPISPVQGKPLHKDPDMHPGMDVDMETPLMSDSEGQLSDLTPLTESEDGADDSEDDDEVDALDIVRKRVAMAQQGNLPAGAQDTAALKAKPLPPNPKLSYVCRGNKCQNLIPPKSKWKTCQPCRKRYREYCRQRTDKQPKWTKQDLEDDDSRGDHEVMVLPDGHRKCTIRSCYNVIPPITEYRWKMCESCRTRTRRGARKRRHGVDEVSGDERDPSAYEVKFKKLKLLFKGVPVASVEAAEHGEQTHASAQTEKHAVYQTFEELLHVFRNRFAGFATAQAQYLRFKLAQAYLQPQPAPPPSNPVSSSEVVGEGTPKAGGTSADPPPEASEVPKPLPIIALDTKPIRFTFDGEFSVVADPSGGEVASRIQLVQASVGDLLGVDFSIRPPQYRVDEDQRIVGLFGCVCDVLVPFPAPRSGKKTGAKADGTGLAKEVKEDLKKSADACTSAVDGEAGARTDTMQVDSGAGGIGTEDLKEKERSNADKHEQTQKDPKGAHTGLDPRSDMAVKRMSGELEVSVTWDRTHRFLPGLRTVVCFRMVG